VALPPTVWAKDRRSAYGFTCAGGWVGDSVGSWQVRAVEGGVGVFAVDYAQVLLGLNRPLDAGAVGVAILAALADRYARQHRACALHEFQQSGATYLFDLASAVAATQEDRTVGAWTVTPPTISGRDVSYQRGFPLPPGPDGTAVDRGHLIPHLSGGEFGPNIFSQDRALNRGWSEQGRRFRALEREAAATPGALYFGHLLYDDDTAHPSEIETGLLRGDQLHVERFNNRPGRS
jgi:hypothetical protein